MSVGFDPYHKWLGIPSEDQPPHYYRLLGVQPFEADPDVISYAADQRMGLLKTFATSERSSLAENLLDEVARVRVCLLNSKKKQSYDIDLRNRINEAPNNPEAPEGFWLPTQNHTGNVLEVMCPHCESAAQHYLASSRRIVACKDCSNQMSLPSREEVAKAVLQWQEAKPNESAVSVTNRPELSGLSTGNCRVVA